MKIDWINVIVYAVLSLTVVVLTLLPLWSWHYISPWPIVALLAVWVYARRS